LPQDGRVNFRETVVGLRKVAPAVPLEQAEEAALRVLLSYDVDGDRFVGWGCWACQGGLC
jgi:hypothetical protein